MYFFTSLYSSMLVYCLFIISLNLAGGLCVIMQIWKCPFPTKQELAFSKAYFKLLHYLGFSAHSCLQKHYCQYLLKYFKLWSSWNAMAFFVVAAHSSKFFQSFTSQQKNSQASVIWILLVKKQMKILEILKSNKFGNFPKSSELF